MMLFQNAMQITLPTKEPVEAEKGNMGLGRDFSGYLA